MIRVYRVETARGDGGMYMHSNDLPATWIHWSYTHAINIETRQVMAGSPVGYLKYNPTLTDILQANYFPNEPRDLFSDLGNHRPLPADDGIDTNRFEGKELRHGFLTLKDMSNWLDGLTGRELLEAGASIKIVDVQKVMKGRRQVIYEARHVIREMVVRGPLARDIVANMGEGDTKWPYMVEELPY